MHVNDGARGPRVALVDGIAVPVDLQRTIKVRAGLDGAFAVVFDLAAPENLLAFFVGGLQFQPNIEGVYGAPRKEVANLARSNDDVHANIIAAAHGGVRAINWSGNRPKFA